MEIVRPIASERHANDRSSRPRGPAGNHVAGGLRDERATAAVQGTRPRSCVARPWNRRRARCDRGTRDALRRASTVAPRIRRRDTTTVRRRRPVGWRRSRPATVRTDSRFATDEPAQVRGARSRHARRGGTAWPRRPRRPFRRAAEAAGAKSPSTAPPPRRSSNACVRRSCP